MLPEFGCYNDMVVGLCTENDIVTSDRQSQDVVGGQQDGGLRPLEKKAINFLVNEYLLANNYKITSVTFAEENEDQVFNMFQWWKHWNWTESII